MRNHRRNSLRWIGPFLIEPLSSTRSASGCLNVGRRGGFRNRCIGVSRLDGANPLDRGVARQVDIPLRRHSSSLGGAGASSQDFAQPPCAFHAIADSRRSARPILGRMVYERRRGNAPGSGLDFVDTKASARPDAHGASHHKALVDGFDDPGDGRPQRLGNRTCFGVIFGSDFLAFGVDKDWSISAKSHPGA